MTRRSATLAVRFVPERGSTLADLLWDLMDRDGLSQRELATKLDLAPATVHRLLNNLSVPHEHTLSKIARAAGIPITEVRRIAGRSMGVTDPFVLPEEANQLTPRQRAAICELVWTFLEHEGHRVTRGRHQP